MCGIAGILGRGWVQRDLEAMVASQHHRGPDSQGLYVSPGGKVGLGHNRLSILDLSAAGLQPMADPTGRYRIVLNGEVYNYLELRRELDDYPYQSSTDTEVLLAAYIRWGGKCLDRLIGMFAFAVWDEKEQSLFAARDRFGVKPFYYSSRPDGTIVFASEIKALHAAGVPRELDAVTWATYLASGVCDNSERTFWEGVYSLPGGHRLIWQDERVEISRWYDLAACVGSEFDMRPLATVQAEYTSLLMESVRLRFRSDVPVGINLSGGVDSSTLLGLVQKVQGADSDVKAFTFVTGDSRYDELPWVHQMLDRTCHPSIVCQLEPQDVPALALSVQKHQDEPFGGLPTLAYARLFECARAEGVIVLLDGQGMDEQWAGYDYYPKASDGDNAKVVQGTSESPARPECLTPEFRSQAKPFQPPHPFPDRLRNMQFRDARFTKIPRALRFNDRVSMRSSTELREPFLDHRLFELAMRQPPERKIVNNTRKWLLRQLTRELLPEGIVEALKRPIQTPQREWLRGPLRAWADAMLEKAIAAHGGSWVDARILRKTWSTYCDGYSDNSFYVWQWISLGLQHEANCNKGSRENSRVVNLDMI